VILFAATYFLAASCVKVARFMLTELSKKKLSSKSSTTVILIIVGALITAVMGAVLWYYFHTKRYDTRSYFNVRSKADTSQLNLPHGNDKLKSGIEKKLKSKKRICSEVSVNSPGNPWSQSLGGKLLQ